MEGIQRFLNTRGFTAVYSISLTDKPCFTGWLTIASRKLQLELRFSEGKFNYPIAYLPEWVHDSKLRAAFGFRHINAKGRVCYADESRTWWDSAMATEMVAGALESIEEILVDNLSGAKSSDVIARDFGGYWDGGQTIYVARQAKKGLQFSQVQEDLTKSNWLIPKDEKSWVQVDSSKSCYTQWVVLRLDKPATSLNPNYWPPNTISQLLEWIYLNSPSSLSYLVTVLRKNIFPNGKNKQNNYSKKVGVVFVWPNSDSDNTLGCGASFTVPEVTAQAIGHNRLKQATTGLRQSKKAITRYNLKQADPDYIQTRNTPYVNPSLKDKRVILIGVGTIGCQIAKLLCAYSAGWGQRGELHLIDPDIFSIENIGRHLLGASHLNKFKAQAVATRLQQDFPYLNIKAHPNSITENWALITENSIIIDATGCQTVSIAIPDYLSRKKLKPLILHSWVHGHGSATVAFLNDRKDSNAACFRCLWHLENGHYQARYPLSRNPELDTPIFAGCHNSYHSYTSTVSMMAATQAITLLNDYLYDRVDKTLRFQVLNSDMCQNRPDTKPDKAKKCPLCHR